MKEWVKGYTMAGKATIKDVAREAGVSLSSVHLALSGKTGVSEKTRQRIIETAERLRYSPNLLATNLKREARRILVVLPEKDVSSRYYYGSYWEAVEDYRTEAETLNLILEEVEYKNLAETLNELDPARYSGLVTTGYPEKKYTEAIRRFSEGGMPVVLLDNDLPDSGRLRSVLSDTNMFGRLLGELLTDMICYPRGKILVCAGNPDYRNHSEAVDSLRGFLEEDGIYELLPVYFDGTGKDNVEKLICRLQKEPVVGCCSINSRSTLVAVEALEQTGLSHVIPVIGCGSFKESEALLSRGKLKAIVDKMPYLQCRKAMESITDILTKPGRTEKDCIYINPVVIFRSMLPGTGSGAVVKDRNDQF